MSNSDPVVFQERTKEFVALLGTGLDERVAASMTPILADKVSRTELREALGDLEKKWLEQRLLSQQRVLNWLAILAASAVGGAVVALIRALVN